MKKKPLIAYFSILVLISGGFIAGIKLMGKSGNYLAGPYMFGPAISAFFTRLFFYGNRFSDAHLRLGRWRDYLRFWAITLGIVLVSYVVYTLFGSISWDFSGGTFLLRLKDQMAMTGKDINDLPAGLTPKAMLVLFFIGGLTIFNIPMTLTGFGEEFGWRGFMFPQLYRIRPWIGFIIGGLIWFAWHLPLLLVMPGGAELSPWQQTLNITVLAVGSVFTFIFFAYVYARSGTIWLASFVHAVFNNGSQSFSYFASVDNQLLANLGLAVTMFCVVAVLFLRKDFEIFDTFFSGEKGTTDG
jgi:membrane protease YdiL (CAAX protease family)